MSNPLLFTAKKKRPSLPPPSPMAKKPKLVQAQLFQHHKAERMITSDVDSDFSFTGGSKLREEKLGFGSDYKKAVVNALMEVKDITKMEEVKGVMTEVKYRTCIYPKNKYFCKKKGRAISAKATAGYTNFFLIW